MFSGKLFTIIFIYAYCGVSHGDEEDPCEPGDTSIYPHPKECQMYYNCSLPKEAWRPWLGDHVMECRYPYLFSVQNGRHGECRMFDAVTCGSRTKHVHGCEYRNNQCNGPHCRPCIYDYPECTVKNGVMAIPHMLNSPYFGVCVEWRISKRECPVGKNGRREIFDPVTLSCKYM